MMMMMMMMMMNLILNFEFEFLLSIAFESAQTRTENQQNFYSRKNTAKIYTAKERKKVPGRKTDQNHHHLNQHRISIPHRKKHKAQTSLLHLGQIEHTDI